MKRKIAYLSVALAVVGCHKAPNGSPSATPAQGDAASSAVPVHVGYLPGRWRLAELGAMERSIVWVSHLVVMHRDSQPGRLWLRGETWAPDTLPNRSRDEAYRLAEEARSALAGDASKFGEVVRKYSDDVVTRERQGSLGGVRATRLHPAFLDALNALPPGQASEVVETPMGFHVVLLRNPPPPEQVNGARIVIAYGGTQDAATQRRSRNEAFEKAAALVREARAGRDFAELVQSHSEAADRVRHGAMGVWSTRDPSVEQPMLVEALAQLEIGEISDPIDSSTGVQILKRLPEAAAQSFAMRAIWIPRATAGDGSKPDDSYVTAKRIAQIVRSHPSAFEPYAEVHCCNEAERWAEGHGDPVMTAALENLHIGEVTAAPVLVDGQYAIVQRLTPDLVHAAEPPVAGVPAPSRIDLANVFEANPSDRLIAGLKELTPLVKALRMQKVEEDLLTSELAHLQQQLAKADTSEARVAAYNAGLIKIHRGMSASTYARAIATIETWVSSQLLKPRG